MVALSDAGRGQFSGQLPSGDPRTRRTNGECLVQLIKVSKPVQGASACLQLRMSCTELDPSSIRLGRCAIAAGARSDDFDRLAGAQSAGSADKGLDTVAEAEGAASAGVAALEPPGRGQQP